MTKFYKAMYSKNYLIDVEAESKREALGLLDQVTESEALEKFYIDEELTIVETASPDSPKRSETEISDT